MTSGKLRCASAGPTSTVPGMVQKKANGCRYNQQKRMVIQPLMKKTPKIHDASSASESPPRVPTARMIANGAVAENTQPMKPFAAYVGPKSASISFQPGGGRPGFSRWENMQACPVGDA